MFVLKEWRMDELPDVRALMTVRPIGSTEDMARKAAAARIAELSERGCQVAPMNAVRDGFVVTGPNGQLVGLIIDETPDPGTRLQRWAFALRRALGLA